MIMDSLLLEKLQLSWLENNWDYLVVNVCGRQTAGGGTWRPANEKLQLGEAVTSNFPEELSWLTDQLRV